MTEHILYLFPDTNVFIQCRPLDQLDWSEWREFSEIHLLVSRPVQREIDNQKNRGNDRVANKARTTYTLFRKIIDSTQGYELVSSSSPTVKLFLEAPSRPSSELQDTLDYNKADDEIVGCLHRFREENQGADARLLTYDGGPMMTARTLDLPYIAVKEDWLLPPENNNTERENARLKELVAKLERTEPQFNIELLDDDGNSLERLSLEHSIYDPLSYDAIEELMTLIMERFPKAIDFGPRDPTSSAESLTFADFMKAREIYVQATDEEIERYSSNDYPKWLNDCRETLSHIHTKFQLEIGDPEFMFAVSNDGTRPGNDALVEITAKGNFEIYVPPSTSESEERPLPEHMLPVPPTPPKGRLMTINDIFKGTGVSNFLKGYPFETLQLPHRSDVRRDPNGFYYKPNRPTTPGDSITLECEQWRHGTGPFPFYGQISMDPTDHEIKGALTCEVHAGNLSTPVSKLIPVRISVKRADTLERARELIEDLK